MKMTDTTTTEVNSEPGLVDLAELFNLQVALQMRLGNDYYHNQEFINVMTLACVDELFEALRETPFKPWKKQQRLKVEEFKEELIDAWHFLINLSLASGMNAAEVCARFKRKNEVNHERQSTGY